MRFNVSITEQKDETVRFELELKHLRLPNALPILKVWRRAHVVSDRQAAVDSSVEVFGTRN